MAALNGQENGVKGHHCTAFIPGIGTVDGRTRPAKAYEAIVNALVADLGGKAAISRAALGNARRASVRGVTAGQLGGPIVASGDIDPMQYQSVANAQGRLLFRLGLKRVARDVTPPLADYLASKAEGAG